MPFFVDVHPEYQKGLDFKKVKRLGYQAAIIKATQGTGYVPYGLDAFYKQAKNAGLTLGFYHFLDDSDGDRQAAHFVSTVEGLGGPEGRLLVVDFEQHPNPSQTATNGALHDFVRGVKKRTNDHAVVLYSGYGFWTGGDSSGQASDYGVDALWDARYPDMEKHNYPRAYYHHVKGWYRNQSKWGGMSPSAWQFTSAGRVAGQYIDVDRFFGSRDDLLKLTTRGKATPVQHPDKPHPSPEVSRLAEYVAKPLAYLEKTKGGPYTPWVSGNFSGLDKPPAWAANEPPPNPDRVAKNGAFCAGMLNLACRVNGLRIFRDTANWWAGGVAWWGEHLANKGVLRNYDPSKRYPSGTLFIEFYRGAALADQGHVAIQGRHGNLIQSDALEGVPRPGINEKRTHRGTHDLLRHFGGRGWEKVVMPEDWLK